jgi:DNA-binding transcriptional LysR family regulator
LIVGATLAAAAGVGLAGKIEKYFCRIGTIKARRMSDLNEILAFARVAQLASFSAAARSLLLPVSTVSRKVSALEARLGLSLMKRTTRRLSLTEHGARLYRQCAPHLQGIEEAQAGSTQSRVTGRAAARLGAAGPGARRIHRLHLGISGA